MICFYQVLLIPKCQYHPHFSLLCLLITSDLCPAEVIVSGSVGLMIMWLPVIHSYAHPASRRVLQQINTPSSITAQGDTFMRNTEKNVASTMGTTGVTKLFKGCLLTHLTSFFSRMSNCGCHSEFWYSASKFLRQEKKCWVQKNKQLLSIKTFRQ